MTDVIVPKNSAGLYEALLCCRKNKTSTFKRFIGVSWEHNGQSGMMIKYIHFVYVRYRCLL